MALQLTGRSHRRFLIDIDTQRDFLLAEGGACVRNHRKVLAHIRRVMAWARRENIPIISTTEIYPNNNGASVVDYCLDGTDGQKKIPYTLHSNRMSFAADDNAFLPANLLQTHRQVILRKRSIDPFAEPRIDRLLSEVQADEFILIGAGAAGAVKATALGLLRRGKTVQIVVDAIGSHNGREAKLGLRKMQTKGARLIVTKNLAGSSRLRQVGACKCERCRGRARPRPSQIDHKD
jgi:nicotinamidase-related amidase